MLRGDGNLGINALIFISEEAWADSQSSLEYGLILISRGGHC